ncbi:MAG: hypothetical protein KAU50_09330 [Candidatus Marinimicrobia bacterium]|nr:hypothetical protein [Candidatus Neomarinimicrobiota bacterium]
MVNNRIILKYLWVAMFVFVLAACSKKEPCQPSMDIGQIRMDPAKVVPLDNISGDWRWFEYQPDGGGHHGILELSHSGDQVQGRIGYACHDAVDEVSGTITGAQITLSNGTITFSGTVIGNVMKGHWAPDGTPEHKGDKEARWAAIVN